MPKPGVRTQTATSPVQILFNVQYQLSLSCRVSPTGVTANADGKKIVPAGTPLYGDVNNRDTDFTVAGTTVAGILLHATDVTDGINNAACLTFGFVNLNRLDTATQAKITSAVKTALPMVQFLKG